MPQILQHIDAIARAQNRDVLILEFHNFLTNFNLDYKKNSSRTAIIEWLTKSNIGFSECGGFADETRFESYKGQLYLDVAYDANDPIYRKLENFLENPDGTMRFDGVWFNAYSLDYCQKNSHHDVSGFWNDLVKNV